jgi:hypothetical protein
VRLITAVNPALAQNAGSTTRCFRAATAVQCRVPAEHAFHLRTNSVRLKRRGPTGRKAAARTRVHSAEHVVQITSEKRLQHVRTTRKNDPGGARLRARPRHVRGLRRRNRRRALTYGLVHVDRRARSSMSRTGSTQPGRLEQDPDRRLPRQRVETPRTQTVGGYRRLHMGPAELHPMITAAAPTAPRALHREDLHDRLNCPTVATRQSSAYSPIVASTRSGITSLLGAAVRIPQVGSEPRKRRLYPPPPRLRPRAAAPFWVWKLMGVIDPGRGQHDCMSRWTLTRLGRRPKVSVLVFSWRGFGRGGAALHTRES